MPSSQLCQKKNNNASHLSSVKTSGNCTFLLVRIWTKIPENQQFLKINKSWKSRSPERQKGAKNNCMFYIISEAATSHTSTLRVDNLSENLNLVTSCIFPRHLVFIFLFGNLGWWNSLFISILIPLLTIFSQMWLPVLVWVAVAQGSAKPLGALQGAIFFRFLFSPFKI